MKIRKLIVAGILMLPAFATASSPSIGYSGWLERVPALSSDAQHAYTQWTDDGNGRLTPGIEFQEVERGLSELSDESVKRETDSEHMVAQQMTQWYSEPLEVSRLKFMTQQQLMDEIQKWKHQFEKQAQSAMPSSKDDALHPRVPADTTWLNERTHVNTKAYFSVLAPWRMEQRKLAIQERHDPMLPGCPDQADCHANPAALAVRQKYATLQATLAARFLPRAAVVIEQMRADMRPFARYADAVSSGAEIETAGDKQGDAPSAFIVESTVQNDLNFLVSAVKIFSKMAAQPIADEKNAGPVLAVASSSPDTNGFTNHGGMRWDSVRVSFLQKLSSDIALYKLQTHSMPVDLLAINLTKKRESKDPESGTSFEYAPTGNNTYRLCAVFAAASDMEEKYTSGYPDLPGWKHPAGKYCFTQTADENSAQLDLRRERALEQLSFAIGIYRSQQHNMPATLQVVDPGQHNSKDPLSGAFYEYVPDNDVTYRLCAIFSAASKSDVIATRNAVSPNSAVFHSPADIPGWEHSAGYYCFTKTVRLGPSLFERLF